MAVFQRADRSGTVLGRKITPDNRVGISEWLHTLGLALFDVTITDDMVGMVVVAESPPRVITLAELNSEFRVNKLKLPDYWVPRD